LRWLGYAALGYLAFVSAAGSLAALPAIYQDGLGWNARRFVSSSSIAELRHVAADPVNLIFSNEDYGMYFHTGKLGHRLAGFPPEEDESPIYLAIFHVHRDEPHPLPLRYEDSLTSIAEDEVLSIYLFEPD
jgi:hypothetical protein